MTKGMKLSFTNPAADIAPYIAAYYLIQFDYPRIVDIERADVGYLRFMLSGHGEYVFASGARITNAPVTLLGPSTETATYSLAGPLFSLGCVLRPAFWGGMVEATADAYANRASDAAALFGTGVNDLFEQMMATADVHEMAHMVDAFLRPRIRPLAPDQLAVIDAIGDWLDNIPIATPDALYANCQQSPRQVMRIANRYFGAPPKLLARKFRALRTASKILGTRGQVPEHLVNDYADRAHMSREIKIFTGLTPRALQINSSPIMQVTLYPENFNAMAPWGGRQSL